MASQHQAGKRNKGKDSEHHECPLQSRNALRVRELLRHANSRITLDVYTQATTTNKRAAQSRVVKMMVPNLGETKGAVHPQNAQQGSYCTHIEPGFSCHSGG